MSDKVAAAFTLGVQVADAISGRQTPPAEVARIVRQLANSEITLLDTPEEFVAAAGPFPASLEQQIPELLRSARESHRQIAKEIEPHMHLFEGE